MWAISPSWSSRKPGRDISDADARLTHELADCLWSILVLAQSYGIDLEQVFLKTMEDLERALREE
jgi:NTP pyrophosphatase (non-canonical NTP hydrolase)